MSDVLPPSPIDRLIDNLAKAGVPSDEKQRDELKQLFRKRLYKFIPSFPCPTYDGTNPFQPVAGQGITYNFTPDVVPFTYTLTVIDVTVDPPVIVFQQDVEFAAAPFQYNVPATMAGGANTFIEGHEYIFILNPCIKTSTVLVPFGCVSSVTKTATKDAFKKIVFTAIELVPSLPC